MNDDKNNQLAKLDNDKILALIESMPNLKEEDKQNLQLQIMSDNLELRNKAIDMMMQSQQAQDDISKVMVQILEAPKKGAYINAKQTAKTGSGKVEIEVKGGDTKFIVPVLTIIAVVVIIVLFIIFY